MTAYWITFKDGSKGCCEGLDSGHAILIAEKVTGKTVELPDGSIKSTDKAAKVLPYPANPLIWQYADPVSQKTPPFCRQPDECAGHGFCHASLSCVD